MKSVLAGGSCTAAILAFSLAAYAQTTGQTPQPGQPSSQPSSQSQQMDSAQQVTITGCVQSEGDFRRARGAGHGGAAGTGVGAGNEFILIDASHGASASDTQAGAATSGTATGSATGTTGTTSGTATTAPGTAGGMPSTSGTPSSTAGTAGTMAAQNAFELSGPGEGQLQQYVGRRVEIVGRIKGGHGAHHSGSPTGSTSGSATQSGSATGSTTSGTTQSGTTTGTQSGTSSTGVAGATRGGSDIMGQDLNLPELEVVSVREASGSCPASQGQDQK